MDVLEKRLDVMPDRHAHDMVWHLCHEEQHVAACTGLGKLAIVSYPVPQIPEDEDDQRGMFLMRLHPLRDDIQPLPDDTYGVRLTAAVSFPHATVWCIPKKKADQ